MSKQVMVLLMQSNAVCIATAAHLAISALAHQHPPAVVLDGSSKDLTCARRVLVHQHWTQQADKHAGKISISFSTLHAPLASSTYVSDPAEKALANGTHVLMHNDLGDLTCLLNTPNYEQSSCNPTPNLVQPPLSLPLSTSLLPSKQSHTQAPAAPTPPHL